ncbi:MAG: hypothetical protein Q8K75_08800 [Chlamydiales bacterium]|nr:hypothetical protein [Chlamydiales bacterium]
MDINGNLNRPNYEALPVELERVVQPLVDSFLEELASTALNREPDWNISSHQIGAVRDTSRAEGEVAAIALSSIVAEGREDQETINWAAVLDNLASIFAVPHRHEGTDNLRSEVPRPPDVLLDQLVDDSTAIVDAVRSGSSDRMEECLTNRGCWKSTVSVTCSSPDGSIENRDFTVWEEPSSRKRLLTDNSAYKLVNVVLPKLSVEKDCTKWDNLTPFIKTCTSLASNSEATFSGDKGAIVYLGPNSQDAVVTVAPHDVISPTESFNPKFTPIARSAVEAYLQDQEKMRLAFDAAASIKLGLLDELNQKKFTVPQEEFAALNRAIQLLSAAQKSPLEKKYYLEEIEETNLETEWKKIKQVLDDFPDLQSRVGVNSENITKLGQQITDYLNREDVQYRGVLRNEVSGWGFEQTGWQASHPLNPALRTIGGRIKDISDKLKEASLLTEEYMPISENITYHEAVEFAQKSKDLLLRNIFKNIVANYTMEEATKILQNYKDNPQHQRLIEDAAKGIKVFPNSYASAVRSEGTPLNHAALKEVISLCNALMTDISEANALAKTAYSEIQVIASQVSITGFGIKEAQLKQVADPSFSKTLNRYRAAEKAIADRAPKLTQAFEAIAIAEAQFLAIPENDGEQRKRKGWAITSAKQHYERLKRQTEKDRAYVAEHEDAVLTYELMIKAEQVNLPCFVHYGAKEEFPPLRKP